MRFNKGRNRCGWAVAVVCAFFAPKVVADPVGVSFNETLKGYGVEGGSENDTIADFEAAYAQGKQLNQTLGFGLYVSIPDLSVFLQDPKREGVCAGYAESKGLTPGAGAPVETGGRINIFDGGVLPTHELRMEYTLPFVGDDGLNYTLTGVKHIPSNDCIHLASEVTTLYVHVRQGYDDPQGKIVRKGVVKIGPLASVKLVASLKVFSFRRQRRAKAHGPGRLCAVPRAECAAQLRSNAGPEHHAVLLLLALRSGACCTRRHDSAAH
jgi:hypothetical protein